MMPTSNLKQRAVARLSATVALATTLIAGLVWWMLTPAALPPAPTPSISGLTGTPNSVALKLESWSVDLWRPLTDAPVVAEKPEPPPKIRLFSILSRDGAQVAALQIGAGTGLVYAKSGEVIGKITVKAIDSKGVDLTYAGQPLRVEMGK